MEKQHALQQLEQLQKKLYAIHYACSAMNLDADTVAPKNTSEGRGVALGVLAGEEQQLMICPETRALLDELDRQKDELDLLHRREVEELRRRCDQLTRIPAEEYIAYSELVNKAGDVWHKAKEKDDFAMFCPLLQELVEYNRKFAAYYDSTRAPYDALLNEYERGVDTKMLDEFFATLGQTIVPLLQKIARKPQIDDSFLHNYYPVDKQKAFADYLMQVMGLDRGHCGLGETEHPFTLEFNNKDVRITTNYDTRNVASSMYSVLHEGGHALYELGIRDDLQYTCLAGGVSMGVHESQSRFYENILGRNPHFWTPIYEKMSALLPEFKTVPFDTFIKAINDVHPSMIRTEADEVTYGLHIILRYEIEKAIFRDNVKTDDLPALWNQKMQELLGITPANDAEGILQDMHWSDGSFGYFPSYLLGSIYDGMYLEAIQKDLGDLDTVLENGRILDITHWLKEKIHRFGSMYNSKEVIQRVCGKEISAQPLLRYFEEKYSKVYEF